MLAAKRFTEALLSAGMLRSVSQFDQATELLTKSRAAAPAEWHDLIANEDAALAWHQGDAARASELWSSHRGQDNPVIQFNRGLSCLFSDAAADGEGFFTSAIRALADTSGWHHLASLYLTWNSSSGAR
jgi:hypothetical protein